MELCYSLYPFFSYFFSPFCSTDGTFFNLRLPQWVIKWQRAKCSASPHPADRRMSLLESIQFQLEPVSNRFLLFCIYFLCHPVPFSAPHIGFVPSSFCGSGSGIVTQSRWPSLKPPQKLQDKFGLIRVFKPRFGMVHLVQGQLFAKWLAFKKRVKAICLITGHP